MSAIVGSPFKDRLWNLRASNMGSESEGQANKRTRVVASLQEFQGIGWQRGEAGLVHRIYRPLWCLLVQHTLKSMEFDGGI